MWEWTLRDPAIGSLQARQLPKLLLRVVRPIQSLFCDHTPIKATSEHY
jgi:hypothetical protein